MSSSPSSRLLHLAYNKVFQKAVTKQEVKNPFEVIKNHLCIGQLDEVFGTIDAHKCMKVCYKYKGSTLYL